MNVSLTGSRYVIFLCFLIKHNEIFNFEFSFFLSDEVITSFFIKIYIISVYYSFQNG